MYEVPKSKKSLKQNQFRFKINDTEYSMPLMKFIKPSLALKLAAAPPAEQARLLFEEFVGPDVFEQFDDMDQLEGWFDALQEASGVTVGESVASSDS